MKPVSRKTKKIILLGFPGILLTLYLLVVAYNLMIPQPSHLGQKRMTLKECPDTPNCVSSQTKQLDKIMEPIHFSGPLGEARERLKKILDEMPRTTIVTERPDYLHVEFRSFLFRFVDDVEFVLEGSDLIVREGDKGIIHFRSASRLGRSDLGVNRKRMEKIKERFRELSSR